MSWQFDLTLHSLFCQVTSQTEEVIYTWSGPCDISILSRILALVIFSCLWDERVQWFPQLIFPAKILSLFYYFNWSQTILFWLLVVLTCIWVFHILCCDLCCKNPFDSIFITGHIYSCSSVHTKYSIWPVFLSITFLRAVMTVFILCFCNIFPILLETPLLWICLFYHLLGVSASSHFWPSIIIERIPRATEQYSIFYKGLL